MLGFLASLRTALAGFVATLEQAAAGPDLAASPAARLAVEHGLAVHRASLAWTGQAISTLTGAIHPSMRLAPDRKYVCRRRKVGCQ